MDKYMNKMAHLANIIADRCETIARLEKLISDMSETIEIGEDRSVKQADRFNKQQAILANIESGLRKEVSGGDKLVAIREALNQWEGEDIPF